MHAARLLIPIATLALLVGFAPRSQGGDDASIDLLVFSKTAGFRHGSIPHAIEVIQRLGDKHAFAIEATEDAAAFEASNLEKFDAVVFLNTTGDVLGDEQQQAFESYIRGGGGFVGIHAATDTEYDWPWYGKLVGARFKSHPPIQPARIAAVDRGHPSTDHLEFVWRRTDEWYDFDPAPPEDGSVRILLRLDESSYEGGVTGAKHPICWCHEFEGGRAWYTGGGHTSESYDEPLFQQHLVGGIEWAAGRSAAATSGQSETDGSR